VIAALCDEVVTAEGDVNGLQNEELPGGLRTGSYMSRIES
jgi:hypothetical protein